ncbi:MAG: hypothetical protein JWM25_109 [Thermoleophilia bacterium]|nr:hypothetical protein [Thermoleophilia bacterium]
MFEDFEAALKVGGVALSEVVAPREDDYWLAVDFPSEARAQDAANALAPIAAEGMFGALEVRRAGVSVAVVPPTTGPLEEMYSDMPDIKLLRRCTTGFDVVPTEGT